MVKDVFPGPDLCCTDPAQRITTSAYDLSDLDHLYRDLSDLLYDTSLRAKGFSTCHSHRYML